jgi:hypothetical protein
VLCNLGAATIDSSTHLLYGDFYLLHQKRLYLLALPATIVVLENGIEEK